MSLLLLDTGPLVALLDRRDPYHEWSASRLGGLRGRLATTGAVVTECAFFLQDVKEGMTRLSEFLARPGIEIMNSFKSHQLQAAAALMEKYADTPMDFADATLVVLAAELQTDRIVTLDERGFRRYRHSRTRAFQLVLQDGDG
jgi:predicted nucleic acid-binding protein